MIRVMIADDHALMRRIVREILDKEEDIEVIAEAGNGLQAQQLAEQMKPDVVLMDIDMPECDGFEGTDRVLASSPQSHVVVFTASHQERHLFRALQHGAIGYLTKDIEPEVLVQAIRRATRDEFCLPNTFASQVAAHLRNAKEHSSSPWNELIEPTNMHDEKQYDEFSASSMSHRMPRRLSSQRLHALPRENASQHLDDTEDSQLSSLRPLTEREQEILDLMRKGQKNREIATTLCIAESTVHKHVQNIFEKLNARNRTEAIYLTSVSR